MNTQKNLIDSFKKVCICRSITAGTILKAMREGALSFNALRRAISVGTGNGKAKRGRSNIEQRLKDFKEEQKSETDPVASKEM